MPLLILKAFFDKFLFVLVNYWRVILVLGLCWYGYHEKTLHARAVQELATYKADIALNTAKLASENKLKFEFALKEADTRDKAQTEQLKTILNNYQQLLKKEKSANENAKLHLDSVNKQLDSLRGELALYADPTTAWNKSLSEPAASGGECWPADTQRAAQREINTLKSGLAVETSQFNDCRAQFDANCSLTGCE